VYIGHLFVGALFLSNTGSGTATAFAWRMCWDAWSKIVYSCTRSSEMNLYIHLPMILIYPCMLPDGQTALEEKTKSIRIEGQAEVQAETWLFDPAYPAEIPGIMELSSPITALPQSINTL